MMTNSEFYEAVLAGYKDLLQAGLPVAFAIGCINIAANIIISAFFGGKFRIGGRSRD